MGLSGGQKQRVAVASAMASERPLILFDEPTSGLDLFHMRQVANVVNQVANTGRTALVVTHDPEFILRCCNYVAPPRGAGRPVSELGIRDNEQSPRDFISRGLCPLQSDRKSVV